MVTTLGDAPEHHILYFKRLQKVIFKSILSKGVAYKRTPCNSTDIYSYIYYMQIPCYIKSLAASLLFNHEHRLASDHYKQKRCLSVHRPEHSLSHSVCVYMCVYVHVIVGQSANQSRNCSVYTSCKWQSEMSLRMINHNTDFRTVI